ncbi:MAG TPA: adenylate/guanylate cyclase domain-containing protein [Solirubrobacteraceae bacterium]|nr:adenylate/guanylate cyclase domain-containing protein [Solirubrobacteraceae bacterium]
MSEHAQVAPAAIFDAVLAPGIARRTISARQIEADGGPPVRETLGMMAAFGLAQPDPDQPAFTPEEATAYVGLERLREHWPPQLALQLARVYGRQTARIAQASVQLFRLYVERRLLSVPDAAEPRAEAVQAVLAELLPLADPFLVGVHQRWIEHALAQEAVAAAEQESGTPLPGATEVTLLFCDLKGFTAYTDREGDAAAVGAIDRFADVVVRERGPFGFMKSLGDGVMLSYGDTTAAVAAAIRIMDGMVAEDGMPRVHASVHRGVAIAREGDWFGGAVNLTARLLALAGGDELLASSQAAACAPGFPWRRLGHRRVRGVAGRVEVFRLAR